MNIWIDINHIPQWNFYKPLVETVTRKGHRVWLTVLDRGKLAKIVRRETEQLAHVQVDIVGRHRMTKWSAIVEANLIRDWQLWHWARGKKIDIGFSNGMQLAMVCRLKGIPNYSFDDDPQTRDRKWKEKWNTECNFCVYEDETIGAPSHVLRCTKEWAYLNPRTFVPKVEVLEKYGVKPKEYMFLREVSVGTINYAGQASGAILGIKDMIPTDMRVLFSLEEKKRRDEYPADWIMLQEPIEDIHSLIYYSAGLVSSGDSMAREAALLGVPSYYLGIRYSMPANAAASKVAQLQNRRTQPFEDWIKELNKKEESSDTCSISTSLDQQSANEQDSLRTSAQSCLTDTDAQSLSDNSSQKNVSLTKKRDLQSLSKKEMLIKQQQELRAHIDAEFIDINAYMLSLVESVKK